MARNSASWRGSRARSKRKRANVTARIYMARSCGKQPAVSHTGMAGVAMAMVAADRARSALVNIDIISTLALLTIACASIARIARNNARRWHAISPLARASARSSPRIKHINAHINDARVAHMA